MPPSNSRIALSLLLAACLVVIAAYRQPARAADAAARGRILFLRCASCHDVSDQKSAKIGPNLLGVVGRRAASQAGYPYSAALRAQDIVWDAPPLDRWLTDPNSVAPGTAMAFAGIADAADRQALIAYLARRPGGSAP